MEPVVTMEMIDELPWGPSTIRLAVPLEVEVTEDASTQTVTMYSADLGLWGDGSDYTTALLDFALAIETHVDELRGTRPDKMHETVAAALRKIDQYIPQNEDY